jgi:serine/threonine protein kinase
MLTPGTRLNHYRILRQVGAGGMGEVYEAEDTRLKRRIALKVLPAEIGADPGRRARFEQEAQAVAALNHPNIVTIHSVEESGFTRFLTMEIVDGSTIDCLVPPTGLPLSDLLTYAIPIVEAVAAAHERGIIHRDLKPANVMVGTDGRVKVLDFGVAKLVGLATPGQVSAETTMAGSPAATSDGQIVGTASYMSPEQADGHPVDHRSDIFSLGVLLYEMATGVRPFRGDSNLSLLSSIVRDQPTPLTRVRPGSSLALERVVNDCLAKDPASRPQSARELRDRLQALRTDRPRRTGRRWRVGVAAASSVAVAAIALVVLRQARFTARETNPGTPVFSRITYENGIEQSPSFSPDGREIAYVAEVAPARRHVMVRSLDRSTTTDLSRESNGSDEAPSFSPDGRSIAFASSRDKSDGIFVMSATGEGVRRLTNGGADPVWTPDGKEIVYSTESGRDPDGREAPSELWAVNVLTGQKRRVAGTDAVDPRISPDGRLVAFWALPVEASGDQFSGANRDVWVQPMAGGTRVRVTASESSDWNPAWSADGRFLYFSSDRAGAMNIWRVAVDPVTGAPAGTPAAITAPASYVSDMSIGTDGTLAYTAFDYDTAIRSVAFDPVKGVVAGNATDVVSGHRSWIQPDVSPDGRLLTMRSFRAQEDVWVVGVDGTGLRPLTNDAARDRGSRFAPDGSLLFYSSRSGDYQFWTVRPDGGDARQLTHVGLAINYPLPSPDGRWVAGTNPNTNEQYIFDPRDWSKPPERLPASPAKGQTYLRDWSPDVTRIVAADTSSVLWVFDRNARTWESVGAGLYPRWLPDGRRVVAGLRGRLVVVDTATKTSTDIYTEAGRYCATPVLTRDGRRLYFSSSVTQADIWTMRLNP